MYSRIQEEKHRVVRLLVAAFAVSGCTQGRSISTSAAPSDEAGIGYQMVSTARATSPTTSIFPTAKEEASVRRVEELLIGRAVGVDVRASPTGGYSLHIRGEESEPLILINGVAQPTNLSTDLILAGINPGDVRRIDVLRGSSGAAYGLRGGSGVIMIELRQRPD